MSWIVAEAGFDRIPVHIADAPIKVLSVTDYAVEVIGLPQSASSAKKAIYSMGRSAFERLKNRSDFYLWF